MYDVIVFMSTYNGEKYIKEQLESLIAQNGVKLKLYIRDDGSSDNTINIIEKYKGKILIKLIKGKNVGPAESFIRIIEECKEKADYYVCCDQDDVWDENKIIYAIKYMNDKNENIPKLYFSNVDIVDKNLNFIKKGIIDRLNNNFFINIINNPAIGCTVVFNNVLKQKLNFPQKVIMHDWWLLKSCLCLNGKVYKDKNSYIKYRQHDNNVIGAKRRKKSISQIIEYAEVLNHISEEAQKLLALYNVHLDKNKKKYIEEITLMKKPSFIFKMKVLFLPKYNFGILRYTMRFKLAVLLKK